MRVAFLLPLLSASLTVGCRDFDRMIDQPRYSTYEQCDVFPNGTIMQDPPEGTVHRGQILGPRPLTIGVGDHGWVEEIPIAIDRNVVERGRNRFDIFCAACHGRLGNGVSQVAENMTLREPPAIVDPPYRDYPPGRIFAVITYGWGLMRSYAPQLSIRDRWAIVSYLQALAISQRARLAELPADLRGEAQRWLK